MNSTKKKKTGSLILLVLEIIAIITLHAIKINKSAAETNQFSGTSSRHVPQLLED